MSDLRKKKTEREQANHKQGINCDVEFQQMVEHSRQNILEMIPHTSSENIKISVCIKKRPLFQNELTNGEIDCVTVFNPKVSVHACKFRVDGVSKYVDNQEYSFDNAFSELESNEELYDFSIKPILDRIFNQGVITVFAYG